MSQLGLAVRCWAGQQTDISLNTLWPSFSFQKMWFIQHAVQYNVTSLPSVSTVAQGLFCGAEDTHYRDCLVTLPLIISATLNAEILVVTVQC